MTNFIHLQIHSEYSLVDSIIKIPQLVAAASNLSMPALALTDYNNLFAAIKFYQQARLCGIKAIFGADLRMQNPRDPQHAYHFTCLCQNNQGYRNLLKLISRAFIERQSNGPPLIQPSWLSTLNAGLLILSGAEHGDIGQALLHNDKSSLEKAYQFWQCNFPERFYLSVQRLGASNEAEYCAKILAFANKRALPLVATNDVRFLNSADFAAHEARVCIQQGQLLADPTRLSLYTEQQYLRSATEMQQLFADLPDALANSVEIAKKCTVTLELGKYFLPQYPVPAKLSAEEALTKAAESGLQERLASYQCSDIQTQQLYAERLAHELTVINNMGFASYFLIVADFTSWAKAHGVPVGPGRGSGVGSLVSYSLKITDLDPIQHDLLFERFLNPERISMPDFDIDFCINGRDQVIAYVTAKYSQESVAQIITYGTMTARAVVRDVGRVLGLPYKVVDKLAKLIPMELGITLEQALEQEPLLKTGYEQDEETRTLIDLALKLEGLKRNAGTHAGGLVIAPGLLTDFTPLYCETANSHLLTQFDKDDVEIVGLVKFDFLGLKTLTIIANTLKEINSKRQTEPPLSLEHISMDDAATFALLQSCKTIAIFQLESRGMQDLVKRLQPDCFDDIMALVALFRPGPLQSGMVDDFINRKHGRAAVSYVHPKLEPILRSTYGVILYQEQVMQIAQVLAGYSLGQADLLRRAMGKKKASEMHKQRTTFYQGAAKNGVSQEVASHIFALMEKFSGYGFNKSHAAAYALISYQTAWLKAHYPAAFMAAVLSADMANTDKIMLYLTECKQLAIKVLPPDINLSQYHFSVLDAQQLIYGLGAIKGLGLTAVEQLIAIRHKHGAFNNLFTLCNKLASAKINRRALEALIISGACDCLLHDRASLLATLPQALQQANQMSNTQAQGQRDLLAKLELPEQSQQYLIVAPWDTPKILQGEKETLGLYISSHPIQQYLPELSNFISGRINEVLSPGTNITVAGLISNVRMVQTKRQKKMAIVTIDDDSDTIEVTFFAETLMQSQQFLLVDNILIVNGEINLDNYTDRYRMLARKAYSLDSMREQATALELQLYAQHLQLLVPLKAILTKQQGGKSALIIHYYNNDTHFATLKAGLSWRLKITTPLVQDLQQLLTGAKIIVKY
jgi:DNA polymerase-3 subunit alpha